MHERRAGPRCHRYVGRSRHCGGTELRPKGLHSYAGGRDGVHSSGTAEHHRASPRCSRHSCHASHNDRVRGRVRVHSSVYAGCDYHDAGACQSSVFSTYHSRYDFNQIDNAQYVGMKLQIAFFSISYDLHLFFHFYSRL